MPTLTVARPSVKPLASNRIFGEGLFDDAFDRLGWTTEAKPAYPPGWEYNSAIGSVVNIDIFRNGPATPAETTTGVEVIPAGRRRSSAPAVLDQAWKLGFDLGREGIGASPPSHMSDAEWFVFTAGHDQGMSEYRDRERDHIEGQARAWEAAYADRDVFYC